MPAIEQQFEIVDRYDALGISHPDLETMCKGPCEGIGFFPTMREEPYIEDWDAAELEDPNTPDDSWHFIKCPDCKGTGLK